MVNNSKYAIEMRNITKIFGESIVNDDITLKIKKSEIHALIGENGAGKSTLINILFGLYKPTLECGKIYINGKLEHNITPNKVNKLGIGMINQHFKLIDIFTVLDNIILGNERVKGKIFLDYKSEEREITKIAAIYNLDIDLKAKVSNISIEMKQRVEILKLLYRGADILIFDEPTAFLISQEINNLLKIMIDLKNSGKTIIFISHKLDEIKKVADSVTVIRYGKVIGTFDFKNKILKQISEVMIGRQLIEVKNSGIKPQKEILLKIDELYVKKKRITKKMALNNFSIDLHAGEIMVITGIEGNGQSSLVNAITGLEKVYHGKIIFNGIDVTKSTIKKRYKLGMSHIPEDSHKNGLILDFNCINNMVLQNINEKPFSNSGLLNKSIIQLYSQDIISKYDIRGTNYGFAIMKNLSEGNKQKIIIGRELTRKHNILIIVKPTILLDVGAIQYIYLKILEEKAKGHAILLVSYELEEIMSLADTIVVLHNGKINGYVSANNIKREELLSMMTKTYNQIKK